MKNYTSTSGEISPICCKCSELATSVLPQFPKYVYDKAGRMTGGHYGWDSYCDEHKTERSMPIALVLRMCNGSRN